MRWRRASGFNPFFLFPHKFASRSLGNFVLFRFKEELYFPSRRGSEKGKRRSQGELAKRLPSGQENWKPQCCEKQLPEGFAQPSTSYDTGTPISWSEGINETFFILPPFAFPLNPEPVIDTRERETLEQ